MGAADRVSADSGLAAWYERELGWTTAGSRPVDLLTGVRFDVLDMPAGAGLAVLRRFGRTGPAVLGAGGGRVSLLVAAGTTDELPGLLDWLDWGGIELDLTARGAGGRIRAPGVPGEAAYARTQPVWLRPPEPGFAVEAALPSLTVGGSGAAASGGSTGPVGLVTLLGAVATECHRTRIFSARAGQPCAFSYASRMVAGTRPRSLTS